MGASGSPLFSSYSCRLSVRACFHRAARWPACGPVMLGDEADLMTGYMPTLQSALPADGVFDLVLQPVADVIYPTKFISDRHGELAKE